MGPLHRITLILLAGIVGCRDQQQAPKRAPAEIQTAPPSSPAKRLAAIEGMLHLGLLEAAKNALHGFEVPPLYRPAHHRLSSWWYFLQDQPFQLRLLLDNEGSVDDSPEYKFLSAWARHKTQPAPATQNLKQLWLEHGESIWGLAALQVLGPRPELQEMLPIPGPRLSEKSSEDVANILQSLTETLGPEDQVGAVARLSLAKLALHEDRFTDALNWTRQLNKVRDPLRGHRNMISAIAHRRRGEIPEARHTLERLSRHHNPTLRAAAHEHLAGIALELRDYEKAEALYARRLVENPAGPSRHAALYGLGWVAFRQGRNRAARRFFDAITAEKPWSDRAPEATYWSCRSFEAETVERQDVARCYARVLMHYPTSYAAYQAQKRLRDQTVAPRYPDEAPNELETLLQTQIEANTLRGARRSLKALTRDLRALGPARLDRCVGFARAIRDEEAIGRCERERARRFPTSRDDWANFAHAYDGDLFPRIAATAEEERVDPILIASLISQVSRFDANRVGDGGRYGLTQLPYAVAEKLAREHNRRAHINREQVLEPARNLRLGARYVGRLMRSFGGSWEYGLAAFHARPGAITRWRAGQGELPPDIFVEEITYPETRRFVKAVLARCQLTRVLVEQGVLPAVNRRALLSSR